MEDQPIRRVNLRRRVDVDIYAFVGEEEEIVIGAF